MSKPEPWNTTVATRGRRDVLKLGAFAALGAVLRPASALAAVESRTLSFYCLHTGEAMTVEYCTHGCYQRDALRTVDHLLRDHRTNQVHPIDPALLDALWALHRRVGSRAELHVVSGYRSWETNELLRRTEHGVAQSSYHIQGRALDFFLPDRQLRLVRRAALGLHFGGVGYYPASGFVHVDSGPVRTW